MIARKYSPLIFALILSGLMSLMVSGISTFSATGPIPNFASLWLSTWLTASVNNRGAWCSGAGQ